MKSINDFVDKTVFFGPAHGPAVLLSVPVKLHQALKLFINPV